MKRYLFMILLFSIMLPCVSANIIILNQTPKDHYALEHIKISGDLNTNALSMVGHGQVISGSDVKIYLFGPASDFLVSDVVVNNQRSPVSFDSEGYYFIASEGSFQFTGSLMIRTIGQIRLYVPGPLNEIEFDITNGYTIDQNSYGLFKDTIILQRTEKVVMNVEGQFHYMFEPYKNSFNYLIAFRSFGGDLGRYTLTLPNGESVEQVTGALRWEQSGNTLVLELEGNAATVSIDGRFSSTALRVPLREGNHHVLIESDPQKKITISTQAREIDLTESPVYSRYSNARAFVASYNQPLNVQVKDLDLLPSLAASVSNAQQTIAVTKNGGVVGQAKYTYSNTGVDYLPISIPGTPLYASTSRGPVKLTKDQDFMLAFPKQNRGTIEVIYYETLPKLKTISYVDVPLTSIDLPITEQSISVIIPSDYFILHIFGMKGSSDLPSAKSLFIFFLLVGILCFALFKDTKYTIFSSLFMGSLFLFDTVLFFLAVAIILIIIIKRASHSLKIRWKLPLIIGGSVIAGIILLVAGISFVGMLFGGVYSKTSSPMMALESASYDDYSYMQREVLSKVGDGDAAISAPMKEGVLPVRLELPQLGKRITLKEYLVTVEKPSELKILMVSRWLSYILYLFGLFFGYLCVRRLRSSWQVVWHGKKG